MPSKSSSSKIVLLTLEEHRHGVWITQLTESLTKEIQMNIDNDAPWIEGWEVEVMTFESTFRLSAPDQSPFPENTKLVVNRISDAANDFKGVVSLLQCCDTLWDIPVFNTGTSYSLTANKWAQHAILRKAGLPFPATKRVTLPRLPPQSPGTARPDQLATVSEWTSTPIAVRPRLLFKPNAGGFGAGIVELESKHLDSSEVQSSDSEKTMKEEKEELSVGAVQKVSDLLSAALPSGGDGTGLVQEYFPPLKGELYRVWFLLGRVQCGLVRRYEKPGAEGGDDIGVEQYVSTGCAAKGSCSRKDKPKKGGRGPQEPTLLAYAIPDEVKAEIEDNLLPLLRGAHCGSVEFLIPEDQQSSLHLKNEQSGQPNPSSVSPSQNEEEGQKNAQQRLYFDINLLSTLPLLPTVDHESAAKVWGLGSEAEQASSSSSSGEEKRGRTAYDPWGELALGILNYATGKCNVQ